MAVAYVPAKVRAPDWVLVLCEDCGRPFHLSGRQGRSLRAEERSARCLPCRRVNGARVTQEHYDFWLDRFTLEEIAVMAEASWGPTASWPADWRAGFRFDPVMSDASTTL